MDEDTLLDFWARDVAVVIDHNAQTVSISISLLDGNKLSAEADYSTAMSQLLPLVERA